MDPPAQVAAAACAMLEAGKASAVFGWPEKLFVRINALLPGVVDGSLRKQLPGMVSWKIPTCRKFSNTAGRWA